MEKILIIGAGGFGREVLWTINDCNQIEKKYLVVGFIDDDKLLHGQIVDGIPVLGGLDWFDNNYEKSLSCIIAVGNSLQKKKIVKELKKAFKKSADNRKVLKTSSPKISKTCKRESKIQNPERRIRGIKAKATKTREPFPKGAPTSLVKD